MNLRESFANTSGKGVLATASASGRVSAAIYATPHLTENGTLAFIMRERLIHENLKTNPFATYLFMEDGKGYKGLRLYLKKEREDTDEERIAQMTRRHLSEEEDKALGPKYLVSFTLEKTLKLVGGEEVEITG